MACKQGQFDVVELIVNKPFRGFSINLNAQHVNGMTHLDMSDNLVLKRRTFKIDFTIELRGIR